MIASERLGHPSDARVLILNLDDFGMHPSINTAVVRAIRDGVAASCSLMPPCPGAAHAMNLLREHPEIPFGIHLTLVSELPEYRWGPLAANVPSLVDIDGRFHRHPQIPHLLTAARLDEVEVEFRAQIDAVVGTGLAPTHLDWHCIADGGRPDIFDLSMALAAEYGLALRVWTDRPELRSRGLPIVDNAFLDSFSLDLDGKADRYAALLRALPAGLSEWAVHPGLGDAPAREIDPDGWQVRRSDFDFLMSQRAREIIAEEGIVVIDYRSLQHVWTRINTAG